MSTEHQNDDPVQATGAATSSGATTKSSRPRDWLRLWFRMNRDVGPADYAVSGLTLMAIKYAVEAGLICAVTGNSFSPADFLNPLLSVPITSWDEPRRLAFEVTEQPDTMRELSPFGEIHPPHLEGNMRSRRGEFRLIALADGRTRLEGRTWYELEMFPQSYWTLLSDAIIHRIHRRELDHIQSLCERD